MSSNCSTDDLLPEWLTIGFTCGSLLVLLCVSIMVLKEIKITKTASPSSSSSKVTDKSIETADKDELSTAKKSKERGNEITLEIASSISSPNKGKKEETAQENTKRSEVISETSSSSRRRVSAWNEATCGGIIKLWAKQFWARKGIYTPIMAHIADTSTDIAAVVEFALIASQFGPEHCGGLDIWWLMSLSIGTMVLYRVIASWTIWKITGSIWRVLMQIIDIEIFHVVYYGHKMGLNGASSPQRLIAVLEAVFEAAPQSVLQMVYLVKTGSLNPVISLSTMLSLVNLTNTLIADDKKCLKVEFLWPWKNNDKPEKKHRGSYIFSRMILLYVFRMLDVPGQIISFVMIWHYSSGYTLTCVIAVDAIFCSALYKKTNNTDALLSIIAIPWSFGEEHMGPFLLFFCWSPCRSIAIFIIIWVSIMSNDDFVFDEEEAFIKILLIFCSVALIFRFVIFCIFGIGISTKERRDLNDLLQGGYFQEALELIFYINPINSVDCKKIYGRKWKGQYSLLAVAAHTGDSNFFQLVMEEGLDNIDGQTMDGYQTALMVAVNGKQTEFLSSIFEASTMNKQYLMRWVPEQAGFTALSYAIRANESGLKVLEIFLKGIKTLNDDDIAEVLNKADNRSKETALQIAGTMLKGSLSTFKMVYDCYPTQHKLAALKHKDHIDKDLLSTLSEIKYDRDCKSKIKEFVLKELEILDKNGNNERKDDEDGHEKKTNIEVDDAECSDNEVAS